MKASTRWFSGIGTSWLPDLRSSFTAACSSSVGWDERRGHREQLVDRRRLVLLLGEPVAFGERLHLVGADAIDEAIEVVADPRLGAAAVRRLDEQVRRRDRTPLARAVDVSGVELALPGPEVLVGLGNQQENGIGGGNLRKRGSGLSDGRRSVDAQERRWRPEPCAHHRTPQPAAAMRGGKRVWRNVEPSGAPRSRLTEKRIVSRPLVAGAPVNSDGAIECTEPCWQRRAGAPARHGATLTRTNTPGCYG